MEAGREDALANVGRMIWTVSFLQLIHWSLDTGYTWLEIGRSGLLWRMLLLVIGCDEVSLESVEAFVFMVLLT